jgi:hypothetical protein
LRENLTTNAIDAELKEAESGIIEVQQSVVTRDKFKEVKDWRQFEVSVVDHQVSIVSQQQVQHL